MLGLAKYLKEFNWQPIIITGLLNKRPDFNVRYEEIDYHCFFGFKTKKDIGDQLKEKSDKLPLIIKYYFLKPIYNFMREIIAYPDEDKYWRESALKKATEIVENEDIDAIISIWPITSHIIAKELKNKYKIPWLADFPDPWSQNHDYPYSFIRKFFDERLELRTLSNVNAITAAAPLYKRKEEIFHKRPVTLITQGFDPGDLNCSPVNLTKKFTITYTGTIYKNKQMPEKIFIILRKLITEKKINSNNIEIRFYGSLQNWLEEKIRKFSLSNIVKQYGVVPRQESLNKQRESHLLLFLNWEDKKAMGVYPLKIFEYLFSKRPIFAIGGFHEDDVEKILIETKAGVYASAPEEIENSLLNFYQEYKNTGKINYRGDLEKINKYSYRQMAKKFAYILNQIT
jgi:hypothetical protein